MKKKINKFKIIMTFVFIVLAFLLLYSLKDIINVLNNNGESKVEILEQIKDYDYSLTENDSKYFKTVFNELKKELSNKEIEEEKYAELIGELFVIDFFSLDNAISKNDVGGLQFIYTDYKESFIKFAKDGIYKYVNSNIYDNREQVLPIVKDVEINSIKQQVVAFNNDITDELAYYVELTITYEEDLEYQEKASLIIIHNNDKLEIAKME